LKLLKVVDREAWFSPAEPIWMRFHDAGHLLGSNMIETEIRARGKPTRILFSGDVGRYGGPLYHDPTPPPPCDYLICESTYGDRDHPPGDLHEHLAAVVNRSIERGGVMLMASFAVGRAQQLIFLLQHLIHARRIPALPIYLDSPMSIDATEIYRAFRADHDLGEEQLVGRDRVLAGPNVHLVRDVDASKALNHVTGPAVIISSSGMMIGGRILHHLKRRLPEARNTIVIGGFMAAGTRGRRLQEGAQTLRMHGRDVPVEAAIETVPGLSGHADRSELLRWLSPLPAPRRTFLTHGEPASAGALAETLRTQRGWEVSLPSLHERVELAREESGA
jgi:metallo-beta-lactamase family protein